VIVMDNETYDGVLGSSKARYLIHLVGQVNRCAQMLIITVFFDATLMIFLVLPGCERLRRQHGIRVGLLCADHRRHRQVGCRARALARAAAKCPAGIGPVGESAVRMATFR
jgi:hypothetical protein